MSATSKVVGQIGPRKIQQRRILLENMDQYYAFFCGTDKWSVEWCFDWGWIIKDMDVNKETGVGWVIMEHGIV